MDRQSELEDQISQWRRWSEHHRAISRDDIEELEDHLRNQIAELNGVGLSDEEAFLVAIKRLGQMNTLASEFAREHSERLWKQLLIPETSDQNGVGSYKEIFVVIGLAALAAILIKLPALFGLPLEEANAPLYARNLSLFAFPSLGAYFFWKRKLPPTFLWLLAVPLMAALVFANIYPPGQVSVLLTALHMPIALWLLVGIAYAGPRWWGDDQGRLDFIRFTGELFIYYVLVALGGGVLTVSTVGIFNAIGMEVDHLAENWIIPCGAMGAVVVCAWLVEAKQSVIENMAPVLTRVFTPLFALLLLFFLFTMLVSGRGINVEREVLIAFDLLLVLVLGLLLYAITARSVSDPPGFFDLILLVLIICTLLVDVLALAAIAGRISEFGFTPNRVAALGENLLLLINLGWSAVLYGGFLAGREKFPALLHWQARYLPAFSLWAAIVVIVFPPWFNFI